MAKKDERPHPATYLGGLGGAPLSLHAALSEDIWDKWVEQVRTNDAYRLPDPDNPDTSGPTGASGWNPPPTLIVQYGPGPHDYISTDFDAGQVIVRDGGAGEGGRDWKFPESDWRRFVAAVRGEELPEDERETGPTQYEQAAEFNKRTAERAAADEQATPENKADKK